jgi:hypothetical protein
VKEFGHAGNEGTKETNFKGVIKGIGRTGANRSHLVQK